MPLSAMVITWLTAAFFFRVMTLTPGVFRVVLGSSWAPNVFNAVFANIYVLAFFAVALALLLISELPMFSLKLQGFGWNQNKELYIFLMATAILLPIIGTGVVMALMPLYVLVCFVSFVIGRK